MRTCSQLRLNLPFTTFEATRLGFPVSGAGVRAEASSTSSPRRHHHACRPRKGGKKKKGGSGTVIVGRILVKNKLSDEVLEDYNFRVPKANLERWKKQSDPVLSGQFDAAITGSRGSLSITWGTHTLPLTKVPDSFKAATPAGTRVVLLLSVPGSSLLKEGYKPGEAPPPSTGGGTTSTGDTPQGGSDKGGTVSSGGGKTGGQAGGRPTGTQTGGKGGGTTTTATQAGKPGGTGRSKSGSKYGWLGWLELPQDVAPSEGWRAG